MTRGKGWLGGLYVKVLALTGLDSEHWAKAGDVTRLSELGQGRHKSVTRRHS